MTDYAIDVHGYGVGVVTSDDVRDALAAARSLVSREDYDTETRTIWVELKAQSCVDEDDYASAMVQIDPAEPACVDGAVGHDWRTAVGPRGHGGGAVWWDECRRCGVLRQTDTWATIPQTGEQGLRSVEYRPGDAS